MAGSVILAGCVMKDPCLCHLLPLHRTIACDAGGGGLVRPSSYRLKDVDKGTIKWRHQWDGVFDPGTRSSGKWRKQEGRFSSEESGHQKSPCPVMFPVFWIVRQVVEGYRMRGRDADAS